MSYDLIISWIVGAKKIINSVMHKWVTADRVAPSPPINIVGVDVFGLWNIVACRTRDGLAHSKRGVVLFSCLTSRAVHIEIIEELSSLAFINALTRFISIRRAIRETNSMHISVYAIYVDSGPVKNETKWAFNSPHELHFTGKE